MSRGYYGHEVLELKELFELVKGDTLNHDELGQALVDAVKRWVMKPK